VLLPVDLLFVRPSGSNYQHCAPHHPRLGTAFGSLFSKFDVEKLYRRRGTALIDCAKA
jgi:hypothetical protein